MTLMAPARAADLAEAADSMAREQVAWLLRRMPGREALVEGTIQAALNGTELPDAPGLHPDGLTTIRDFALDSAVTRMWRRHRIVYTVDSDLAVELADTDPGGVIPGGLVRQLPHPNPYLAFPEPLVLPVGDHEQTVCSGAFLVGVTPQRQLTATDSPDADSIALILPHLLTNTTGQPVRPGSGFTREYLWARLTLPADPMPMADMIAECHRRFADVGFRGEGHSADVLVPAALRRVVPLVVYLCAENAETRRAPTVATRRRADGGQRPGKPPAVVEVGYAIGPALGAARRAAERRPTGTGTGAARRAHVRRAHWHTYRVGPGRTGTVLRWLAPIAVRPDQETTKTTVVPTA